MKMSSPVESGRRVLACTSPPKCKRELQLSLLALVQLARPDFSRNNRSTRKLAAFVFVVTALLAFCAENAISATPQKLPSMTDILTYVDQHFANTKDFRPGDIISTSYVAPLFDGLEKMSWSVPNRKSLLERVPSDKNYVVQQLRTDRGRKFMQQICNLPLGYDRLFHLASIPLGQQQVHDLIRLKDGYKMIEYMTTTKQGKNLGTQLSYSPHGANFNQPTGQIYTVEVLKAELEKSYAATLDAMAKEAK